MDGFHAPGDERQRHVIVVEDDAAIGTLIAGYIGGNGLRATLVNDAGQLRCALRAASVDLILLDLGLPDADGVSLLRELQLHWGGPVIVVTGRGECTERVAGLEMGADDYITKPFELRELLARVRTVLRRCRGPDRPAALSGAGSGAVLEFDGFRLCTMRRQLRDRAGQEIALTTGEFELLHTLLEHPGQVLSRDRLMNAIHGRDAGPFDRAIDVGVSRLRHKIEPDPASPRLIKSVRCAGYFVAVPVHRA